MNIGHHRRKWKSPILHELFFVTYFRLLFFLRTWNQNFFFCFHVGKFSCPFSFAQEYLLFFRLQAKQNFHYNDQTRSGLRPSLQIPLSSCSHISTCAGRNLKMATSPQIFASTALPPVSIKMRSLVFGILQLLALDASDVTGHLWMVLFPPVSRVSPQSTASNALAPGLGIVNAGVMMVIVPEGVMIPITLVRSAFHRRTVRLNVRARVVAASNTGQADWLIPIATIAPS
jgi:hypothetical protein